VVERLPATSPARTAAAQELVRAWRRGATAPTGSAPDAAVGDVDRWVTALGEQPSSHARFDLAGARLAVALRDALRDDAARRPATG
jgi:hypothetical protein